MRPCGCHEHDDQEQELAAVAAQLEPSSGSLVPIEPEAEPSSGSLVPIEPEASAGVDPALSKETRNVLAATPGGDGIPTNPLTLLSDEDLVRTQLSIALLCLRSRSVTRRKHSSHACALLTVLNLEGDRRGVRNAHSPYRA